MSRISGIDWRIRSQPLLLSSLSGILFALAWPPAPFGILLSFALLPLLYLSDFASFKADRLKLLYYCFLAFFIRNILCLYWIGYVQVLGAFLLIILLSLLNSLPLFLYHICRKKMSKSNMPFLLLMSSWLCMEGICEYLLRFPWLNLGLGLAENYQLVQWYEYTGPYGGSLWLISLNLLLYKSLQEYKEYTTFRPSRKCKWIIGYAALLLIPSAFSWFSYAGYKEYPSQTNFLVIQSHVNAYTQKFRQSLSDKQTSDLLLLSSKAAQPDQTQSFLFIWPETALEPWHAIAEDSLNVNPSIRKIQEFLRHYPSSMLLTGIQTYRTSSLMRQDSNWYNSALFLQNSERGQIYHKQKLVPGVEAALIPCANEQNRWSSFYLGGPTKLFTKDQKPRIFFSKNGLGLAPVICFESVFSSYVAEQVLKGAQFIVVITNDDWWGKASGTWQHACYARLLAIENRRSLARSANSGVSCLVNQRGDMVAEASQGKEEVLSANLNAQGKLSFYTKHGDFVLLMGLAALLLTASRLGWIFKKNTSLL